MFSDSVQESLKALCRASINEEFTFKPVYFDQAVLALTQNNGVFVTLKIKDQLRGCIGVIETEEPLYESIYQMAKKAAFSDPRFLPLKENEFPAISIELSVMSVPELVDNVDAIQVGIHGLIVRKGHFTGLLLPQVAKEWGWDRIQFLEQTAKKAGLAPNDWKTARIWSFSAFVF